MKPFFVFPALALTFALLCCSSKDNATPESPAGPDVPPQADPAPSLRLSCAEESFLMHRSADERIYEGVSSFTEGENIRLSLTGNDGHVTTSTVVAPFTGVAYVTTTSTGENCEFLALPTLLAEGNAVKGFGASSGVLLFYAGKGIYKGENLVFTGSSEGEDYTMTPTYPYSRNGRARFTFIKPGNNYRPQIRRLDGTRNALENKSYGSTSEMQINPGTYDITVDLRRFTFDIRPVHDASHRITVMGSSVPTGTGASGERGYMYLYGTQALTPGWTLSNRSVPGNSTVTLADRYDDLVTDGGKYVIYALSLGNEGIHGAADQQAVYDQWKNNMQALITRSQSEGRTVVVTGNYGRGDFNASDYARVKAMNLEIQQWDVPSVNLLGAVDDGAGHWPSGYQNGDDTYHPNDAGHAEMSYTLVPSLFDALAAGKGLPVRQSGGELVIYPTSNYLSFTPEATVHPFTFAFSIKTTTSYPVFLLKTTSGSKSIDGNFRTKAGGIIGDGNWHQLVLTHYYAQGVTVIYVDGEEADRTNEQMVATEFTLGIDATYREIFFWRSAMNAEEIAALYEGKMLRSSLELYAPLLDGSLENQAQSTNALTQNQD